MDSDNMIVIARNFVSTKSFARWAIARQAPPEWVHLFGHDGGVLGWLRARRPEAQLGPASFVIRSV